MDWVPEEETLASVVSVLHDSFAPDSQIQRKVQESLAIMHESPDFVKYLLCVLKGRDVHEEQVRALCAILLKNNVDATFASLTPGLVDLVRQECLDVLMNDPSKDVRRNVTVLIATVFWRGGMTYWPHLLSYLCTLVESSDTNRAEIALLALFEIGEEYLVARYNINDPVAADAMNQLFVKFVSLFSSDNLVVRTNSLKIVNRAMQDDEPLAVIMRVDANYYLQNIFRIIDDDRPEIRKLICQSFCILIDTHNLAILQHMNQVIEYILTMTQRDEDEEVALQACEFWLAVLKVDSCRDILNGYIHRLLPVLFKHMKYSNEELHALKNYVGEDHHLEDRAEDVKPFGMRASASGFDDEDDDGCDYERDDMVGESSIGWTLRKCSAATLDALSLKFKDDILPIFLPILNEGLACDDYLTKEASILALGAIAEGCVNGLREYMPKLIEYLMQCMNSDRSLVRVIACWTLSRYVAWIVEQEDVRQRQDPSSTDLYFLPVMTVLLGHFQDTNKRVQHAALSAFCVFQEEARGKLVPYVSFILRAFLQCFDKFKSRSYLLLYDAIGVLAQSVGNYLNKQEYIDMLMPSLMYKFNSNEEYCDEQFMALMECLSNVVIALEIGFLPFAESVYGRCSQIIADTIVNAQRYAERPDEFDAPDRDPMCVAHDLLLGLAIGLKTYFVKFVANGSLVQNLCVTMHDEHPQVRQPALALYGELVKLCFYYVSPTVHTCIPIIIDSVDIAFEPVCNNAAWVVGRLCVSMGDKIEPYAPQIIERLTAVMQSCDGYKTVYQTVAISLCTLGLVCPNVVAPHMHTYLRPCCSAIRNVADCEEKDVGFRGLCALATKNPSAVLSDFAYFCDAVASWNDPKPDLRETIRALLFGIRRQFTECGWLQFYEQMPPALSDRLGKLYDM